MKTIEVVAAIIKAEDKILSTQRGYGEFKGGWEFPGGKLEKGETNEEALKREIKEELNVEINIDQFVDTVNYDYDTFHLIMHCYLCSIKSGKIILNEHSDATWLNKESLDDVDWLPADVELIETLKGVL